MSRPVRKVPWKTAWLATAIALGPLSAPVTAAMHEEPAPTGKYKVLIVAINQYDHADLGALKFPVQSGVKLANALHALHYDVTVYLDADRGAARKAAANLSRGISVEWQASPAMVRRWLGAMAAKKTEVAFLVLVGHGVMRKGERGEGPWFLTRPDKPTAGGLELAEVKALAAKRQLPLVVVMDTCLEVPRPKRKKDTDPTVEAQRVAVDVRQKDLSREPDPIEYREPTVLYSTAFGKVAHDAEDDLVSTLADGLAIDKETHQFRAGRGNQRAGVLTLEEWFHYAVCKNAADRKLTQLARLDIGRTELHTAIAQADPPGPPKFLKLEGGSELDLLRLWRPEHGGLDIKRTLNGQAWLVTAPRGGTEEPWIGGFIHEKGAGFDTIGKAVFVEVVATYPPLAKAPGTAVFGIDVKHVDDPRPDVWLSADGKPGYFEVPVNRPTWCKIELRPRQRLNYLAVTNVPRGCLLTVRRLFLGDAREKIPAPASAVVELLPRWWVGDGSLLAEDALPFGTREERGRKYVWVGSGKSWRGGIVAPAVLASAGDVVELEIENPARGEVEVLIHAKEDYVRLADRTLTVEPGRRVYRLPLRSGGQLNYFAVIKPTGELKFWSVRLKPADPHLAAAKSADR